MRDLGLFWAVGVAVIVAMSASRWAGGRWDSSLHLRFIDVGQGDAILIQLPGGDNYLLDAGPRSARWDSGQRVLIPELARRGVTRLAAAILSHPDADHAGGYPSVLGHLDVGAFWTAAVFLGDKRPGLLREILASCARNQIPVAGWRYPAAFTLSGVQWRLWAGSGETPNDRSLVLRLDYRGCSALLGGDISSEVEDRLPQQPVTLLKVSHHGSRYSTGAGFLAALRPKLAVISAGQANRYGHPHPVTLERLRGAGADTLRTDFHGQVNIRFDREGRYECSSYLGPCGRGYCSFPKPN